MDFDSNDDKFSEPKEDEEIPETYSVIEERNQLKLLNKNMPLPSYEDVCPPSYTESIYYPQIKLTFLPDSEYDLSSFTNKQEEIKAEKRKRELEKKDKERAAGEQIKKFNKQSKFLIDLSNNVAKFQTILSQYRNTVEEAVAGEGKINRYDILDDLYHKIENSVIDKIEDWRDQPSIYEESEAETLKKKLCLNLSVMGDLMCKWIIAKGKKQ